MSKIFYVMGKSSSGKDTIYKRLMEKNPDFRTVVPYTTRPVRDGEKDGVEYFFADEAQLNEMQEAGKVIEVRSYNTRCGVWTYFTADDGQINLEEHDYLMIGTLVSYQALKEYFGAEKIVPLYIQVEDGERLFRALEREQREAVPRYTELCRRFLADEEDFSEEKLQEAGIQRRFENRDLEICLNEIQDFIRSERERNNRAEHPEPQA
ncbi:MAG TPA: guanylate kinase [Candidatus Mediterraneibacter norwichensis]|nr:guanylate kinase [Candidatus Mediterraneibacter norwichensis]